MRWELDDDGEGRVGVSLLSTTSGWVADQNADWRIVPLTDDRSLVFYQTEDRYKKLAFRKRVLRRLRSAGERLVTDLRDRCAARGSEPEPEERFAALASPAPRAN